MKITSNVKGQLALSKTELRALELGYIPSKPIFDTRYDLILDDLNELKRVQVKYADGKMSNSDGSVRVKLEYKDRRRNIYTYKKEEVDGLIVYLPRVNKLCFFPPNVFIGKKYLCIRVSQSKNNQQKGVLFANKFFW
ncbi:hypothetical protein A3A76_03270 [Candidatus Woesebacteria bacterium RIFCSPLOWO2_01_FULL_39_23]|uniref:PD(D/E)XK endonuclease domain-containing protein n=1 Tax=Candidatus Woesebacteria bacterium RIFCSPHIGHO2_01_FULL_40_22 TaxID=1802499 RepID=A0A1F7YJN7_9BACT|nr:MAG: hypothetical protein A2141_00755 [Candidatus Woesebacteria bacterium RBG_16_40_11]OGM27482.1 MAG: hypothetical protein A2628_01670 [Candidatus Woesebacteria bacterium RIFCSPHIGHO2_01_FULL_40_22]OGM36561.1 MAG: hypothetical protein A3E41_03975 [Candidatus Woesebacteria bacterium RIFCSPHIGHO2_12_FULL_38_9]OGM62656.1 MAG: hypothetical protein A3A76_03270 [Candidatus Woesebacteria bacterium RIFCSPLOWO2_01_FULL_39_23]